MDLKGKHVIHIEITPQEFSDLVSGAINNQVDEMRNRMHRLEEALLSDKPAFDKEMAGRYCNKGTQWIDKRRRNDNLPNHTVGGTPYFKRQHLDHMLSGGKFTDDGHPIGGSSNMKLLSKEKQ